MLELVIAGVIFSKCGHEAEVRGHSKAWGFLAVVTYFAFEFTAALVAFRAGLGIFPAYAIGIALGAISAYQVIRYVKTLPDRFETA